MVVERPVAQPSSSSRGLFLDVRFSSSSVGFKSLHPAKAMIMSRLAAALNTVRERPYWRLIASSHDAVQRPRISRPCLPRHFIVPKLRLDVS